MMKPMQIAKGQKLRIKTQGESMIIESCSTVQQHAKNYTGEDVLGGWTSKITSAPKEDTGKPLPGQDKEGVDESEWD